MIGNVMDMVISAHKKINQWGNEHHFHLQSKKIIPNNSVFEKILWDSQHNLINDIKSKTFPL
jgi:hypothetical protein